MKAYSSTDTNETVAKLLLQLLDPLPSDVDNGGEKPYLLERFALTRETPKGSVGGWAMKGVLISTRFIEASILFGPPVAGRIEILHRLDRYTKGEIRGMLRQHFGRRHPLRSLAKSEEFRPLHRVLRKPALDFAPVASEIISLLNSFFEPQKGLRTRNDNDWQSIRTGITAAFKRVNEQVGECLQPSFGKVRIRPAYEKDAA